MISAGSAAPCPTEPFYGPKDSGRPVNKIRLPLSGLAHAASVDGIQRSANLAVCKSLAEAMHDKQGNQVHSRKP